MGDVGYLQRLPWHCAIRVTGNLHAQGARLAEGEGDVLALLAAGEHEAGDQLGGIGREGRHAERDVEGGDARRLRACTTSSAESVTRNTELLMGSLFPFKSFWMVPLCRMAAPFLWHLESPRAPGSYYLLLHCMSPVIISPGGWMNVIIHSNTHSLSRSTCCMARIATGTSKIGCNPSDTTCSGGLWGRW